MRVALVSPLPPFRGGIATFSYHLAIHLASRHELLGVNFRRLYPQFLFPGKSQFHYSHPEPAPIRTEVVLDSLVPYTWDLAARKIAAFQPDFCILAYWLPFFIPAYSRIVKQLRTVCTTVVLCHNVEEHEGIPGLRWLKRRFFQAADRLVLLSTVSQDQLDRLGVHTPAIVLFHPLAAGYGDEQPQTEAKTRLGIPSEIPVILFFGLVRPYKGLSSLLAAVHTLKTRNVSFHLRVAGEFYQGYDEATTLVDRWGLDDCVTLENRFIPDHEVSTYFSAADVVALPYRTATQSGVVPIAYHFNRPVVVTEVGGLPEVVREGETGYLVPPGDSHALANALARDLPAGFRIMRSKVAQMKGQFSWESFITRLEEFLA